MLEGLRGVAIVGVVLYHAARLALLGEGVRGEAPSMLFWPVAVGRFGVDVLFVLSGLLVVQSWRSIRARSGPLRSSREFLSRRLARIGPAYWVSLVVLVPLVAPTLLTEPRSLLLLGTMQHYLEPGLPSRVNTPYWSLTTELHFYLLVPLAVWALRRFGSWSVLIACLAGSVAWATQQAFGLPASSIFGRLDQFVAGAVAGEVLAQRARWSAPVLQTLGRRGVGVVLIAAVLALGTWHGATLGMSRGRWLDPFVHPLVGLLVAAGLVRLLTRASPGLRQPVLHRPALQRLGAISYSLYLCHYPVLQLGLRWLRPTLGDSPLATLVSVTALLPCSLVVALALHRAVERPALARLRRRTERAGAADAVPSERVPDAAAVAA